MSQFITDHPVFIFGCFILAGLVVCALWSVGEQFAAAIGERNRKD